MKQQALWTKATHDPLRMIFQGWMTRSMLLLITMVLWSLRYHIFSKVKYKSSVFFSNTTSRNCCPALFSFRILVFLPWTHAVWVQLLCKKGHSHPEGQRHSQLLTRWSATVSSGLANIHKIHFTNETEEMQYIEWGHAGFCQDKKKCLFLLVLDTWGSIHKTRKFLRKNTYFLRFLLFILHLYFCTTSFTLDSRILSRISFLSVTDGLIIWLLISLTLVF